MNHTKLMSPPTISNAVLLLRNTATTLLSAGEILHNAIKFYLHGGADEFLQRWNVVWICEHGEDGGEVEMTTDQPLQVHQNIYSSSRERESERERININ